MAVLLLSRDTFAAFERQLILGPAPSVAAPKARDTYTGRKPALTAEQIG
ncbi:hypothetical protein AB0L82_35325 [Nocardia sp. NPDC052001]